MRKFISILLFSIMFTCAFGQSKSEAFYKIMLKEYKKLEVENSAQRDYIINKVKEDLIDIPEDYKVKLEYNDFIIGLETIKFNDTVIKKNVKDLDRSLTKGLEFREDKFDNKTIISSKGNNTIDPYIVILHPTNLMVLRLKMNFNGNNWIYMDKATFLIDNIPYEYWFKNKPQRDVNGSSISMVNERADEVVDDKLKEIINKIMNTKDPVEVKFSGEKYKIQKITNKEIYRLDQTIKVFNELNK